MMIYHWLMSRHDKQGVPIVTLLRNLFSYWNTHLLSDRAKFCGVPFRHLNHLLSYLLAERRA
jgi:hypothetical protein